MEKTLAFILVILLYTCSFGQETFYTSGQGNGEWNDPDSWMLDETGTTAGRIPTAEANIIIRHSITHNLTTSYTHSGNIEVRKGSTFEIMGEGDYTYTGNLFELKGSLIAGIDLYHKSHNADFSHFVIRNTGLVYALGELHSASGSEILSEQNTCGAFYITDELHIHGENTRMLGEASIISGGLRAWKTDGAEITSETEKLEHVSLTLGNNIQIFSSEYDCEYGNTVVSGKGGHVPDVDLNDFKAIQRGASVQIAWLTSSLASLPDLSLERAWEGEDFSELRKVSSVEINETAGYYNVNDVEKLESKRRYRLSYTNELGEQIVLGVIEAGAGPLVEAYPNPYTGENLTIQAQGFDADQELYIKVVDLQGRELWKGFSRSNSEGNLDYKAQPQLDPGTYLISVESGQLRQSQRLLVF
ncbi:MAG: T9SS type A sorting domain-containing protein [Bacteroidota bacterium]